MTTKPLYMLIVVLGCHGGDLTLPADGSPGQLRAISGYDQQGHVNSVLPELLVVQVVDGAGRPVPNAALRFQTDEPAARLVPAEAPLMKMDTLLPRYISAPGRGPRRSRPSWPMPPARI
jgi:hypothetical protein